MDDASTGLGFFILACAAILYFLPAVIGARRKNGAAIFALNLLLGWTLIGWVGALVWALASPIIRPPDASQSRLVTFVVPTGTAVIKQMRDRAPLLLKEIAENTWSVEAEAGKLGEIAGEDGRVLSFRSRTIGAPRALLNDMRKDGALQVVVDFVPAHT